MGRGDGGGRPGFRGGRPGRPKNPAVAALVLTGRQLRFFFSFALDAGACREDLETSSEAAVPLETTAAHATLSVRVLHRWHKATRGEKRRSRRACRRPSLEAQIDDDEAWLAANDPWDAPADRPRPPPPNRARCPSSAGAGAEPPQESTTEAQRTVDDARRGPGLRL